MHYNSKQREIIKELVLASFNHPTAEDVYMIMINKGIKTSISTVYRNLHQLVDEGVIQELIMPSGKVHFDGRTYEHPHAVCVTCGKIFDLQNVDNEINSIVENTIGMKVLSKQIIIKGVCLECTQKEQNFK